MNRELITDPIDVGAIAVADPPQQPAANDLRHAMMSLPVETQNHFLAAYKASRDNFRSWLMQQLIEGVHYGVVPGCEPHKQERKDGTYYGVWNKKKSEFDWYHERQWRPKPSLYAAGADYVCDIMGVRDEYETDAVGWQQMGAKPGNAVVKCRLKSRATDELIGESLGAYYSQYDANNALKMASKCAKVGAVINAYDLRDLFTQDDPQSQPPSVNPEASAASPKERPRGKRDSLDKKQLLHVQAQWQAKNQDPDGNRDRQKAAYVDWVCKVTGRQFNPGLLSEWRQEDYVACCDALKIPTLEELES